LLSGAGAPAAAAALRRTKGSAANEAALQKELDDIEVTIVASPRTVQNTGGPSGEQRALVPSSIFALNANQLQGQSLKSVSLQ